VQPAAAPADKTALTRLQHALHAADDRELLTTMLRVGDTELTREGRMCLLVTLSRFAPNNALIEAIEFLAWQNDAGPAADSTNPA
jgi:hypothetical protein